MIYNYVESWLENALSKASEASSNYFLRALGCIIRFKTETSPVHGKRRKKSSYEIVEQFEKTNFNTSAFIMRLFAFPLT